MAKSIKSRGCRGAGLLRLAVWACVAVVVVVAESSLSWGGDAYACSTERYMGLLATYEKEDEVCARSLFSKCCDVCPGTEKKCWAYCFANLPWRVQRNHKSRCRRARRQQVQPWLSPGEERRKARRHRQREENRKFRRYHQRKHRERAMRAYARWQRQRRREEARFKAAKAHSQESEAFSEKPAAQTAVPVTNDADATPDIVFDQAMFTQYADTVDIPGALGVSQLKFLVANVQTNDSQMHFLNAKLNETYHFDYARDTLNETMGLVEFNKQVYNNDTRPYLSGSVISHDSFVRSDGGKGIYALEFWSGDVVPASMVKTAYTMVQARLPFAYLAYHPSGDVQREAFAQDKKTYEEWGVSSVTSEELYGKQTFIPLNLGVGFGKLRVLGPEDTSPATVRDVVICTIIPNDMSHVAGVITEQPQTPLSHINLKAKQNKTPNSYLKDASKLQHIAPLLGKFVRYEVTAKGVNIRAATEAEVKANLEALRPKTGQTPVRNLSVTAIMSLDDIGHADTSAFGAKAANVGELRKFLPDHMVPAGFAVPFSFYDRFMKSNGLYKAAEEMMANDEFKTNPEVRQKALKTFRKRFKKLPVPDDIMEALGRAQAAFPENHPIRCRSSTNNEDLEGFNGAGLYDSSTHREDEGHLANTVKKVWRSLWNFRAFEERDFYRIDHAVAAMGVLMHPNFDDELSNGVAVTKHIYDPRMPGYYVNVQVGEALVTNPDAGATPDEFIIVHMASEKEPYVVQTIRKSNLNGGQPVMQKKNLDLLVEAMYSIQYHFKKEVYRRPRSDTSFAMDIEFKEDANGALVIKQARPWVD